MNRLWITISILMALTSSGAVAAPLDPSRLPADAKWVIHFDMAALQASGLLEDVGGLFPAGLEPARAQLQKIEDNIGIDPTRDVLNVTVYDTRFAGKDGVMLIDVNDLDAGRLIEQLKERRPDHLASVHEGQTIYSWTMERGRDGEHVISGTTYRNTIVLSRSKTHVTDAIGLLAGRGRTIAADSPLARKAGSGTIALGRAVGMDEVKTPFNSQIIREARSLSVAAGSADDELFFEGAMVASSPDVAKQCRAVVEGFRGIAALNAPDETARRLVSALMISTEGATVTAQWRASRDDILSAIETQLNKRGRGANKSGQTTNDPAGASSNTHSNTQFAKPISAGPLKGFADRR